MFNSSRCAGLSTSGARMSGVDVRSLPIGTKVVVDTCNSRYRLVMHEADGCNAVVQGGRYFPDAAEARIDGSTLGGSLLKIGWIGLGMFLELSVRGNKILTSRVRSIRVEPVAPMNSASARENSQAGLAYS